MEVKNNQINKQKVIEIKKWVLDHYRWIGLAALVVVSVILIIVLFPNRSAVDGTWPDDSTDSAQGADMDNTTEASTEEPDEEVTEESTEEATEESTETVTEAPTEPPTGAPTERPTELPTEASTERPTEPPTEAPTAKPTEAPTEEPTEEETMYLPSLKSEMDFNGNGVDDYSDFVLGARQDAINHPTYDGSWWATGYPPENIGVCSDVIWRAFKCAGYCLKDMVDADILARREAYPLIERPEHQIDFRRVRNLRIFFEEYAVSLTLDIYAIDEWQPGDIVIFGNDKHIGIVSDIRDKNGIPYIIHNGGQDDREENYLVQEDSQAVTGHYRFDASLIPVEKLIPWTDQ